MEELEAHLRDEIETLADAGLDADEAFLVAVKRIGNLNDLSREFAREHSERMWRQLMLGGDSSQAAPRRSEPIMVLLFALAAALAIKLPALFGVPFDDGSEDFYVRNMSFFILPVLTMYLVWKRELNVTGVERLLVPFAATALVVNLYPFASRGHTLFLSAIHLPIALWLTVGLAYVGLRWRDSDERMNFIRFTGELFIYCVLLALGLHLYSVSARDPLAPLGPFDYLQLLLVASALVVDLVALAAITSRITEFGFTPNRTAALGENLILLVNLAWAAWLYGRFIGGRRSFAALERWQTAYLPIYAFWALIVVVVFPLVFGFM